LAERTKKVSAAYGSIESIPAPSSNDSRDSVIAETFNLCQRVE